MARRRRPRAEGRGRVRGASRRAPRSATSSRSRPPSRSTASRSTRSCRRAAHRKEPERIEIIGGGEFEAVTTSLVGQRDRDDRGRGDRRDRRDRRDGRPPVGRPADRRAIVGRRGDRPRPASDAVATAATEAGRRTEGEPRPSRPPRERRERPTYAPGARGPAAPEAQAAEAGPGAPPGAHRVAAGGAAAHRRRSSSAAGLPGVRQALQDQNAALVAEGKPEIKPVRHRGAGPGPAAPGPRGRVARPGRRRPAVVDELDLRDLRSVVTAAADPVVARDDSTRELAAELRGRARPAPERGARAVAGRHHRRARRGPGGAGAAALVPPAEGRRALPARAGQLA